MRKVMTAAILTMASLAGDTSITVRVVFDEMLTREQVLEIGLSSATPAQKKAFEKWAISFMTEVVQKQHDAEQGECLEAVRLALKDSH